MFIKATKPTQINHWAGRNLNNALKIHVKVDERYMAKKHTGTITRSC